VITFVIRELKARHAPFFPIPGQSSTIESGKIMMWRVGPDVELWERNSPSVGSRVTSLQATIKPCQGMKTAAISTQVCQIITGGQIFPTE